MQLSKREMFSTAVFASQKLFNVSLFILGTGVPAPPTPLKIEGPPLRWPETLHTKYFSASPCLDISGKISLPRQTALEVALIVYNTKQEAKNNDSIICTKCKISISFLQMAMDKT